MVKLANYKDRIIDKKIDLYLETFGAILIEGPKWCGKTWTSMYHSNSEFLLANPNGNFNNKKLAQLNPDLILDGISPRLIDEWQEVPMVWDAVRGRVDANPNKGLFILTGSASVNKNDYIHSGTGRIAHLRMRPMSLFESKKSDGKISLEDICYNRACDVFTGEINLETLIKYILVGGWPSINDLSENKGMLISKEYIKSVLNEDIYKTDNIKRDTHKVELLLKSLARNEATTVTNKTLKNDIKEKDFDDINIDTITDYLNLFNKLYLIENIPPFSSNIRSSLRLKQSEKRHFVDPSLACALLNLSKQKLLDDLNLLGFLFESMVERDLLTYVEAFDAKLYHYQDYKNNEIDAIIELQDGSWCGVEIKLGANQIEEAANNLVKINNEIIQEGGKAARSLCVICGLTNAAYRRNDNVYVVPITSLKD
ncbi:MAG: ATP-binding protein [Bacilli bacterium]|nr:ATP-binding protein [Bacilli bacterium]